jgi:hypothetical protein
MICERRSLISGIIRTLDLPVTEEQIQAWEQGVSIQEAMPNLSAAQQLFVLSGTYDSDWESTYEDDEPSEYFSD